MKKVAIITDGWRRYVNYAWIGGCRQYVTEMNLDADLYVFNSFGNFSKDEKYNIGEYNIFQLPDFSKFDGIIVELSQMHEHQMEGLRERLLDKILASGVPAVSLADEIEGMYFSGIDNYKAMRKMVEHMVSEHSCKSLNYIGGPKLDAENADRLRAFRDVCREHDIPVEEDRIFCMNYGIETGEEAFRYYHEKKIIPEAFICANDNIAVGLCHEAEKFGFEVPGDFLVTGFDNFDKAAYFTPRISTMGFTREEIAYNAMSILAAIWAGDEVEPRKAAATQAFFRESCGCHQDEEDKKDSYMVDRIFAEFQESKMQNNMMELKRDLLESESFLEMAGKIPGCISGLNCPDLCIVMDPEIMKCEESGRLEAGDVKEEYRTVGYPRKMVPLLVYKDGKFADEISWDDDELIPRGVSKDEDSKTLGAGSMRMESARRNMYLFSPLHFRDREVGYLVMKNCDYILDNQLFFELTSTLKEAMEYFYNHAVLSRMNQELSMLYMVDSLTGLYNRMAYKRMAIPLFEKCMKQKKPMLVMFVDVDCLKTINDNHGHDMGNLAIKTLASAIRKYCPLEGVAMRYGGDEFVVMVPDCDEEKAGQMVQEIHQMIARTSTALDPGFPITASIGYVIAKDSRMDFNEYVNRADDQMYEIKRKKKEKNK